MLKQFKIKTIKEQELIDITSKIKEIIKELKIKQGICIVYVPHATAGILINENYDEKVCNDIINNLETQIPKKGNYKHDCIDNNAHAHIKSAIIGPSETIIIENGKLVLGTWQRIALAEFDGPKNRTVFVKVVGD